MKTQPKKRPVNSAARSRQKTAGNRAQKEKTAARQPPKKCTAAHRPQPQPKTRRRSKRRYAVNRLPATMREQVQDLLADGMPYKSIQALVEKKGYSISMDALSHYYNDILHDEVRALRVVDATTKALCAKLLHPDSNTIEVIRDLLKNELYRRRQELGQVTLPDLLFELRQLQRLAPEKPKMRPMSGVEQSREIRKRWRTLYGLETKDETPEEIEREEIASGRKVKGYTDPTDPDDPRLTR